MGIGVLISGSGSNLQAIIDACESQRLHAKILFVGADNPSATGLDRANTHGIPSFVVDYKSIMAQVNVSGDRDLIPPDFDIDYVLRVQSLFSKNEDEDRLRKFFTSRAVAEAAILKNMAAYSFELLVLAGFMRVLTPYMIDRVNTDPNRPRIMNIHPALLPAFPGVDGYGDTYRYGCKVGGCTVHFVDYGEDTGPIIGQKAFNIEPGDTLDRIREKGLKQEWELYPACIRLFTENRLKVVWREHRCRSGKVVRKKVVDILPPRKGM